MLSVVRGNAQASWEQFGQNRVQLRTFEWKYYDSTHFRTFYYDKGMAHALYALHVAEQELSHIVYMMGGRLDKKLNIIIYNSYDDFKQTNIGRKNDEFNLANGGKLEVIGDNIPIYFNGDHLQLKKQIIRGIASVIKDNMLFGDNLKEVVKNAVKMNLPEWYTSGYISYITDDWTPENKAELISLFKASKNKKIIDFALKFPKLSGLSFWNFISEKYGENSISNLLYLTRYRKSVNTALETVLKKPYKEIYQEWENYYGLNDTLKHEDSYKTNETRIIARIKANSNSSYSQFSASPDKRNIAYVEKSNGTYDVRIFDTKYNKNNLLMEGGIRANIELEDPNYPLIAWSPNGKKMAIAYLKKNKLHLRTYSILDSKMKTKSINSNKIERITGMCFMDDENRLAVTAIKKGKSDLYSLSISNSRFEPITDDLFDDKNPVFIQTGTYNGILFLSNRTTPFLGEQTKSDQFNAQFNIFLYDPRKGSNLIQLSNTNSEIKQPIQWGLEQFSYLTQENNIQQRKIVSTSGRVNSLDTFQTKNFPNSNHTYISQLYTYQDANIVEIYKNEKEFIVQQTPFEAYSKLQNQYWDSISHLKNKENELNNEVNNPDENFVYYTPFDDDTNKVSFLENLFLDKKDKKKSYSIFEKTPDNIKPKIYSTSFYLDFIQSSFDNTLLFTRYQPFDYYGGLYQNPPISGFITTTLTDVMEDYKLRVGGRLGSNLTGLDYFLQFNNYRKRTDWGLLYFHHATTNQYDMHDNPPPYFSPFPVRGRVSLDYIQGNVSYPLDILNSVRFQLGLRYDRIRILAKDKYSIEIPDDKQYWAVSKVEYVYDNAYSPMSNIWKGIRLKFFAEYQYKINNKTKGFYNLGYDFRNYITLYKNSILASRLAGAFSGGNAKILYLLGGVDNPLNSQKDENTAIDFTQNYAFQSLATNMRGYKQGFKNGNSYLVLNEEIRIPIWNTFFRKQPKSSLLRYLQLVAFSDIGSAWKGFLPNGDNIKQNNIVTTPNSPVTVYLDNATYDFGLGYGLGLRTKFLGYFIRTDFAWNIEGIKKPLIHISLATDF